MTTAETIETLLAGHTSRGDEDRIITLLALDDDLDGTLRALPLERLFGDVDDHLFGPNNKQKLRDLLCKQRVGDLGPEARAALVTALQRGRTCRQDEEAILALFVASRGLSLTALKNAVDAGGDHRDLQQLVHGDFDHDDLRDALLAHLAVASDETPADDVKILSDIDDTFYCNWKDARFPKKTVYPGVRQLYLELDRGSAGGGRLGDVVFITARPRDRLGWVESLTHEALRALGIEATILCGSLRNLHSNESIAERKLRNFVEYAELYPEYRFLFFGDSGQGDAAFGLRMREHAPERVAAVLIHDVIATPDDDRAHSRRRGVVMFDTYVGAAYELLLQQRLDEAAARRVAERAREELEAIPFTEPTLAAARKKELARDLARLGIA